MAANLPFHDKHNAPLRFYHAPSFIVPLMRPTDTAIAVTEWSNDVRRA